MTSNRKRRATRAERPNRHGAASIGMREAILEEATRIFMIRGYRAASLQHVAAEFGISRPALYYHFKSKRDILYAIYRQVSEAFSRGAQEIAAMDLPPAEKFRRLLRHHVTAVLTNAPRMAVYYDEVSELSAEEQEEVKASRRLYTQRLVSAYEAGVAAGEFADLPPWLAVSVILGACNWAYKWYDPDGPLTPDEVAGATEGLLLHGYLREGARARENGGHVR